MLAANFLCRYRVFFSTGTPLKVSDYIVNPIKKCQNLLTGWHIEFLEGGQLKKPPCTNLRYDAYVEANDEEGIQMEEQVSLDKEDRRVVPARDNDIK